MSDQQDEGARVREWVQLIRMARIGRTTKAVAFALAHYADADGRRIFPGIARLSIECELAPNSVKASLRALREAQLLEIVRHATSRGRANEYRLIIGPNVLDHIEVLSPNEVTAAVEKLAAAVRGKYRRPTPPDLRPTGRAADDDDYTDLQDAGDTAEPAHSPVDNSDLQHAARTADTEPPDGPAARGTYPKTGPAARGTYDLQHAARTPTNHVPTTRATTHKTAEVRETVTQSRASPSQQPEVDSEVKPRRGRHAAPDDPEPETPTNVIPIRRTA